MNTDNVTDVQENSFYFLSREVFTKKDYPNDSFELGYLISVFCCIKEFKMASNSSYRFCLQEICNKCNQSKTVSHKMMDKVKASISFLVDNSEALVGYKWSFKSPKSLTKSTLTDLIVIQEYGKFQSESYFKLYQSDIQKLFNYKGKCSLSSLFAVYSFITSKIMIKSANKSRKESPEACCLTKDFIAKFCRCSITTVTRAIKSLQKIQVINYIQHSSFGIGSKETAKGNIYARVNETSFDDLMFKAQKEYGIEYDPTTKTWNKKET